MKKPMHKPWDRRMKRLFRMVPLDIAQWLFPDAIFNGILPNELEDENDDVLPCDSIPNLHGLIVTARSNDADTEQAVSALKLRADTACSVLRPG
jgi:hypothetical protein